MSPPKVLLAELWQRKSAKGSTYFSGFLGASQLLLFKVGERPHPTRPDETVIVWRLLVQEREERPPGERGDRARRTSTPEERQRAAQRAQAPAAPDSAGFDAAYGPEGGR